MVRVARLVVVSGLAMGAGSSLAMGGVEGARLGAMISESEAQRVFAVDIDSGGVVGADVARVGDFGGGDWDQAQRAVWATEVRGPADSAWVRLEFGEVDLAPAREGMRESYLRITSLEDGYEQYLDYRDLMEWGFTSAFFNGDAVRVEIMAAPGSELEDRVRIRAVRASAPVAPSSICGTTDDRLPSEDPRAARLMPVGCSAWLFGDHGSTMLTAGHCNPDGGDVIQFNVPLSSSTGAYRSPPPSDQYIVDGASIQETGGNTFLGNDWGFFGVFDNTQTGLDPLEAQGSSYVLASSPIANDGRPIRITGYGTTGSDVPRTWNGAQKTHVGPFRGYNGNIVRYTTDTTGGNSGSVIIDENNNVAIGIHTNAGCGTSSTSFNNGCNLFNSALQGALANPLGVASPRLIEADVVGVGDVVAPGVANPVGLTITDLHERMVSGVPELVVRSADGSITRIPAVSTGDGSYTADLAPMGCGEFVSYWFEVDDTDGNTTAHPTGGAGAALRVIALDARAVSFEDTFQTNTGWTVTGDAGVGGWARGVPNPFATTGPTSDGDGTGNALHTGAGVSTDVDGGSTTAASPLLFDVGAMEDPAVSVLVYVEAPGGEEMTVELWSHTDLTWVGVDTIGTTDGWEQRRYVVKDYFEPGAIFNVRFTIADEGADSTVEAGIDGVIVSDDTCSMGVECLADFDGNGDVDFFDLSSFLQAEADVTGDTVFDFFDVSAFLSAFAEGCP